MLVRVLLLTGLLIPLFATTSRAQAGSAQLKVRHIHVWVKDVASTKAFYGDKLGLQVTSERAGEVVEFEGGNLWFGKARFSDPIQTNGITIGIHADSVEAAYRALQQRGIDIAHPPEQHGERWAISFQDPDGYMVVVEGGK